MEFEEFVSLGAAGLVEAAERFDPDVGVSFASFAQFRVRGAIYDGLRKTSLLPRTRYQQLKRAAEQQFQGCGSEPESTGQDDTVLPVYMTPLGAADGDDLPDPAWLRADDLLSRRYLALQVQKSIDTLPGPEQQIIRGHYYEGKTLAELSNELGLSPSWACRLHARALKRLRKNLHGKPCKTRASGGHADK
jgi:RNA polymerase sigma factor for flagellar operon FliA